MEIKQGEGEMYAKSGWQNGQFIYMWHIKQWGRLAGCAKLLTSTQCWTTVV